MQFVGPAGEGGVRDLMHYPARNLPLDFLDCRLGGKFHSPAWKKVTLYISEHFSKLEKEKIQDVQCAKFSALSGGFFQYQ
jgi:hypothetical protein